MVAPAARAGAHAGHQRVGVEERHGRIADVVGGQLEHLGHGRADPGHATLAAQAGLGCPRGTRGEQQVPERLLGDARSWPGRGGLRPPPRPPARRRGWPDRVGCRRTGRRRPGSVRAAGPGRGRAPRPGCGSAASVTSSWHSVWERSRASSSPRWVGLPPTITAPARAAPPIQKMNSGTLSSIRATWNGPGRRSERQDGGPLGLGPDHLVVGPGPVAEGEPHPVVARPPPDQLVDGLHCFPLVVPVRARSFGRQGRQ